MKSCADVLRTESNQSTRHLRTGTALAHEHPDWTDPHPAEFFLADRRLQARLVRLGILCLGGNIGLLALWNGRERTIAADLFGMGTQTIPSEAFFGPLQSRGIVAGQIIIAIGFLMMMPYKPKIVDK